MLGYIARGPSAAAIDIILCLWWGESYNFEGEKSLEDYTKKVINKGYSKHLTK